MMIMNRAHTGRAAEMAVALLLAAILLLLLRPAPAPALTLELGVNDPASGRPMTITLPDDPLEALKALLGGAGTAAGEAVDAVVMNVTGCLREADGKPIAPVVIFLGKFGLPPSLVYGTAAVEGGLPPAIFTNIVGAGVIPAPVPVHLEPGCYWIPIPIDFLDALMGLEPTAESLAGNAPSGAGDFQLFWIMPLAPAYTFTPVAWEVTALTDGSYRLNPITDITQVKGIRDIIEMVKDGVTQLP